MKILLISPYSDIASIGLRIIGAMAAKNGHEVQMAFLPHTSEQETAVPDISQDYPAHVLEQLAVLGRNADIVGITVMTNYFHRARRLTDAVRAQGSPTVVWGGIHPTIRPRECLKNADYVITGEGETAFLDLVNHLADSRDPHDIPNLAYQQEDRFQSNPPRPLIQDLDSLPFPDYGPENHFI